MNARRRKKGCRRTSRELVKKAALPMNQQMVARYRAGDRSADRLQTTSLRPCVQLGNWRGEVEQPRFARVLGSRGLATRLSACLGKRRMARRSTSRQSCAGAGACGPSAAVDRRDRTDHRCHHSPLGAGAGVTILLVGVVLLILAQLVHIRWLLVRIFA